LNTEFASSHQLSAPEEVEFASFDGARIQGWFYPALNASGRTPMILTIHGGPHGQFGYAFNPQAQFWAGRGYAVLAINPRGSSGYGQKFSDGSADNWGGGDYKDLMAGVDRVLGTHANIDPEKLFVTGGSYGGFMTNWVITQTNRFKAAVSVASVSDMISFYATSMYQDLVHAEFRGFPWADDNYALLWKWSPLAHVKNVTTPTMFLHGENDNDVHITQAEQMFTALRQRGIESELVRYPREGHGFREPQHRLDSTERTVEWFDRFLPK
jgi:dipeptidyl aminopeptidase/acylaminoacyl peptidase